MISTTYTANGSEKANLLSKISLRMFDGGTIQLPFVCVLAFSIVGVFLLLIACINYMNLATARAITREREVGIRKVVGAQRNHLVKQFLGESILITALSALFALGLAELLLPFFNTLLPADFSTLMRADLTIEALFSVPIMLCIIGLTLLTGIVAGSYPALYLSRFMPIRVLTGSATQKPRKHWLRKALVVIQSSASISAILCTWILFDQVQYILGRDPGYDNKNLVMIEMNEDIHKSYKTLKEQLLKSNRVVGVTASVSNPALMLSLASVYLKERPEEYPLFTGNVIDPDFFDTLGIGIVEHRFSRSV